MNIALFADVHGRVELCFKLCERWQRETGKKLDYILQAGDLGAFFNRTRLDKATLRFAQNDRSELGFLEHFAQYHQSTADLLSRIDCPLLFVRGNHEDHIILDQIEQEATGPIFPIDVYQRIWCLKTGLMYALDAGGARLNLLGVGRVGPIDGEQQIGLGKYIQPYEQERIYRLGNQSIDLLLTHDSGRHTVTKGFGMQEIRDILDSYQPFYHFYGHTGEEYYQQIDRNKSTHVCKLTDLTWDMQQGGLLHAGSMAILEWKSRTDNRLEIIDTPWFREYSRFSWEYL